MLDDKDLEVLKGMEKRIRKDMVGMENWLSIALLVLFIQGCIHSCKALPIREALSQIESGNNDKAVGRSLEISRFQILPSVWKEYSSIPRYRDENHAWSVAERILADRREVFRKATGRQPNHCELYALWNKPGLFERKGYKWARLPYRVRERSVRFSNLVQSK